MIRCWSEETRGGRTWPLRFMRPTQQHQPWPSWRIPCAGRGSVLWAKGSCCFSPPAKGPWSASAECLGVLPSGPGLLGRQAGRQVANHDPSTVSPLLLRPQFHSGTGSCRAFGNTWGRFFPPLPAWCVCLGGGGVYLLMARSKQEKPVSHCYCFGHASF